MGFNRPSCPCSSFPVHSFNDACLVQSTRFGRASTRTPSRRRRHSAGRRHGLLCRARRSAAVGTAGGPDRHRQSSCDREASGWGLAHRRRRHLARRPSRGPAGGLRRSEARRRGRSAACRSRTAARSPAISAMRRRRRMACRRCWRWTPQVELSSAEGTRTMRAFVLHHRAASDGKATWRTAHRGAGAGVGRRRAALHFAKLGARRYLLISIVMVAASVEVGGDGRLRQVAVAVGCLFTGGAPPAGAGAAAGRHCSGRPGAMAVSGRGPRDLSPIDDVRATRRLPPRRCRRHWCGGSCPRAWLHEQAAWTTASPSPCGSTASRAQVACDPRGRLSDAPARRPRAHRYQDRLPRRRLRCLHRAAGWRAGLRLPGGRGSVQRSRRRHGRGPGRCRSAHCRPAAGLRRSWCSPVRHLHPGHADRAPTALLRRGRRPQPDRSAGPRCAGRRAVSLHRLSQDRRGGAGGRQCRAGCGGRRHRPKAPGRSGRRRGCRGSTAAPR